MCRLYTFYWCFYFRKMLISNSKSAPPPPPPVASIAETTTSSQSITLASVPLERHTEAPVTMEQGGDSLVPSLEDVIERSPKGNIHELLKLIEVGTKCVCVRCFSPQPQSYQLCNNDCNVELLVFMFKV